MRIPNLVETTVQFLLSITSHMAITNILRFLYCEMRISY